MDLSTEQVLCSEKCRAALSTALLSNDDMLDGLERPFSLGWKLWLRALPDLATKAALPVAAATLLGSPLLSRWSEPGSSGETVTAILVLLLAAFAMSSVGVVLTRTYTSGETRDSLSQTVARVVPWMLTLGLVVLVTIAGYLLFILPGIYVALRLFWADELALIHGKNPLAAVHESWQLTRDATSEVFSFQFRLNFVQLGVWLPAMILMVLIVNLIGGPGPTGTFVTALQFALCALVVVLAYGFSHACEVVFFYGLRADYQIFLAEQAAGGGSAEAGAAAPVSRPVRRPARADDALRCTACETPYDPADYRPDAVSIRCSACGEELQGRAARQS